jgi:hypothetical protein
MDRNSTERRALLLGAALTSSLLAAGAASAMSDITYSVDQTIGVGSVVGSVTTDGTLGTLGTGNFVSWSLVLTGSSGPSYTITNLDSGAAVLVQGSDVSAGATAITFDFSAGDNGFILFQDGLFSGNHYWCNAASSGTCFQGKTVTPGNVFDGTSIHIGESGVQIIAGSASGVPEPSTWALMLVGFAALGYGAYRQATWARLAA